MLCGVSGKCFKGILVIHDRLREDIAKEVGFVETHLGHYTGNQWRESFRMMPSTAESLLREIAPFLVEAESREIQKYLWNLC